jgi:pimeloyl-ACP methyl ester carboxylesterase/CheY-like chemotaxis protein
VLVQRDLPLHDAFRVTAEVREFEKSLRKKASAAAALAGRGAAPPFRRHPVICYTAQTSPEDLKMYMRADMDGCVSYPVSKASLLNTVRAAVPHHLAAINPNEELDLSTKSVAKVMRLGSMGEMQGSKDSSTQAVGTLPMSSKVEDDIAFNGVIQIDADTRVPFMVLDASRKAKVMLNPEKAFFNLVVCHDIFDTAEKMKIFLGPMCQRYLGMQVLLWNYPGQAFTEWRSEQLLNNEYLATCLNDVLGQVGEKGTKDFDTSRPFYILGYGNGASIASFYASHYRVPNLRGMLTINGWCFLDSYLAGIMHDCINIFENSPPSRPDLPVYFFSRFLFSKEYLAKVSVPLALNIYTAVHNSISMAGRLGLCKGVLQTVDVRPLLKEIDCPIICLHSTQDAFARPLHAEPFATYRADFWKGCIY